MKKFFFTKIGRFCQKHDFGVFQLFLRNFFFLFFLFFKMPRTFRSDLTRNEIWEHSEFFLFILYLLLKLVTKRSMVVVC